jgi:LysR family transcriptional regulator, regulator for bpeEF and oprC
LFGVREYRKRWRAQPHRVGNMDAVIGPIRETHSLRRPLMDKLLAMATFVRVVEARSFSKAAETLSMPRSSVTTIVKHLEAHLGTALLRRSTRSLSLTEAGTRYFASCQTILAEVADSESQLSATAAGPRGRVRVDMPGVIGRAIVLPRLHEFEARFPDIELVLGLSDRPSDLIHEGIDCVIRTGSLADSGLVARPLGQLSWLTCASPRYLKQYGEPESVAALSAHRIVNYLSNATGRPLEWRFSVDGKDMSVTLRSRFSVNDTEAYVQCGLEGLGLIQLSEFAVSPYLRSGRLKEVLAAARCRPVPVSIVYPKGRATMAIRTFVDWIIEIAAADLAQ